MAKKQLSKHTDNKKDNKKKSGKLKKIHTNQVDIATSPDKSKASSEKNLNSKSLEALKKIQAQLNTLTDSREAEKERLKFFEKEIRSLKKHLTELDNELLDLVFHDDSNRKLQKKLKKFQKTLNKKAAQFTKNTQQLEHEISLFNDLEQRLINRIESLEQDTRPWQQKLDYLSVSYDELFDKITQFESELGQFDNKLQQPEQEVAQELKEFSTTLDQIQSFVEQVQSHQRDLESHQQEQDTSLNLLQTDTSNIRQSLQQVQELQQAEKQRIDEHLKSLTPQLDSMASALTSSQEENKKLLAEQNEQIEQKTEQKFQQVENQLSDIQDAQQQLIKPLEIQLGELSNELKSLRNTYNEQEQKQQQNEESNQDTDKTQFNQLIGQVNQFDNVLKQSQNELNQHIQTLKDSDQVQSEQFSQLDEQLQQLAQQLAEVAEQSSQLQGLFSDLQDQQQLEQQQSKELSEQVQTQQQQLNELDEQLQQFTPLLKQDNGTEQPDALSRAIEQLQAEQAGISSAEQATHKKINVLSGKLEQNYNDIDTRLDQLHNHQLEQKTQLHKYHQFQYEQQNQQKELSDELNDLSLQIKNRSQLFGLGLISVLAISTLLFFNKDLLVSQTPDQTLVTQIKKEVKNETFSKINTLTKQNSIILNNQLSQIREAIKEIRAKQAHSPVTLAIAPPPVSDTPITADNKAIINKAQQKQASVLQDRLNELETELKSEQQTTKKSVAGLADKVEQIDAKVERVENKVTELEKTVQNQTALDKTSPLVNLQAARKQAIIPVDSIRMPFYGIQLSGSYHTESIKDFMLKHQLINRTKIYQTELKNKPWFIVILGEYLSFAQARQDIQQLPEELKQLKPWVRKLP